MSNDSRGMLDNKMLATSPKVKHVMQIVDLSGLNLELIGRSTEM